MSQPIATATTIWMLIGKTELGCETNRPAMAMEKTASTSQIRTSTKHRNISRARLVSTSEARSPIERPFSRTLATIAPKSWTAPMKIVPTTTQISAGSQPQ